MFPDLLDRETLFFIWSLWTIDAINGSQYKLYNKDTASWDEVQHKCRHAGLHFAKISSPGDQAALEVLSPFFTGSFWLGLIGNETDDSFTWSDDTPMDYSNWATGFPNNQDGRNCVRVRYFDNKWETSNCSERLNYLCHDLVIHKHYVVTMETKVKGILLGLFLMGGLIVLCCLLLQLPCCKPTAADKLAHFTFLQTNSEEKKPII